MLSLSVATAVGFWFCSQIVNLVLLELEQSLKSVVDFFLFTDSSLTADSSVLSPIMTTLNLVAGTTIEACGISIYIAD